MAGPRDRGEFEAGGGVAGGRARQAVVLAQPAALVLVPEQPPDPQLGHHMIDEVGEPAGQQRRHSVSSRPVMRESWASPYAGISSSSSSFSGACASRSVEPMIGGAALA
ncbi:hypothetical protein [Nonomuraea fuscirosea]|uniref:hypothetical protein n=1 Tax=Nonomuraea fuscirosea TaxID=1291556 RepID=UPI003430BF4D